MPERYVSLMENQLYATYPKIEMGEIKQDLWPKANNNVVRAQLFLKHHDYYPFLLFNQLEGSFLTDVFNQINRLSQDDVMFFQVKIKPLDWDRMFFALMRGWKLDIKQVRDRLNVLEGMLSKKASSEIRRKAYLAAKEKNRQPLYLTEIDLLLKSNTLSEAEVKIAPIAQSFQKLESDYNEFFHKIVNCNENDIEKVKSFDFGHSSFCMTTQEIGTFFHLPVDTDAVPNLYKILAPKVEPPVGLPTMDNSSAEEICLFARTNYRNMRHEFGIKRRDRARHMYLIGKSGSGKSKLLELLVKSDIETGQGFCVIDPHGDLADTVLKMVPESRINDVIYFNPIDEKFPISFNPLEKVEPAYRQQVATGFIEIFKKIFGVNWTPRLEHMLRMTVLALLDAPKASVMSILLLLTDREYRQEVIKTIDNQVVKNFWTNEFAGWSEKFDSEAIMPILNRIGQFVSNNLIRNIIGQEQNKLRMSEIMNGRKILVVKLPKGVLGEENVSLLGAMIITKIYQAALARAEIDESSRVPFYLYVDEFQNFATDTFANILSEARKYKLSLTMSHQYISQLNDTIRKTVFGNVGSIISFRLGAEDAALLEQEFSPRVKATDITNLGVQEIYLKMSVNDEVREAFSARTLGIEDNFENNFSAQIVEKSRSTYCKSKDEAEKEISREKSKELGVLEKLKDENFSAPIL